jgi:hypothetical protein
MEAVYYAARANLQRLLRQHPRLLARPIGPSDRDVDKQVLRGLSRAPRHPLPRLDQQVVDRVLEIRDDPPEGLGRPPGPKAILY